MPENQAAHYFYNLINVMLELSKKSIVHRDIKAENVLVNETTGEFKLIDFGFSKVYEEGKMMKTACGSPSYCAPEILAKEKYDPIKADIWSSGILLYFLLCGKHDIIVRLSTVS